MLIIFLLFYGDVCFLVSLPVHTVNPEIFARILFSRIALRHIWDVKNSRQGHDLPISVNDRVISAFREDFIFTKLKPSRKFLHIQYHMGLVPRKWVFGVSDKVSFKTVSSATKTS